MHAAFALNEIFLNFIQIFLLIASLMCLDLLLPHLFKENDSCYDKYHTENSTNDVGLISHAIPLLISANCSLHIQRL